MLAHRPALWAVLVSGVCAGESSNSEAVMPCAALCAPRRVEGS